MSRGTNEHLIAAIDRIHRTSLAPETWPRALEAMAVCVDSTRAVMFGIDLINGSPQQFQALNVPSGWRDEYLGHYHRVDPWLHGIDSGWQSGQPLLGTRIVPDSILRQTEFFKDFLEPKDIRFLLTGFPFKSPRWLDVISFFRRSNQDDFDDKSLEVFRVLLGHAAHALEVQRTIEQLQNQSAGLAVALDHISHAVVLLCRTRRVLYANSAGQANLGAKDGLSLDRGRVNATTPDADMALEGLLRQASEAAANANPSRRLERLVVSVPRVSGQRPYVVRVIPIEQANGLLELGCLEETPHLLMVVSNLEAPRRPLVSDELRAVYGLTRAEASLAAALAQGETISQFAVRQNIATDTARKQLRAVFRKTETHRQIELIQRLIDTF